MLQRSVFFLSDRTGITAETLGHSLLTQFDGIEWKKHYASFLDSAAKAQAVIEQINTIAEQEGQPALVFSTLLDPVMLASIRRADCVLFDFFETCLGTLEAVLQHPLHVYPDALTFSDRMPPIFAASPRFSMRSTVTTAPMPKYLRMPM